MRYASSCAFLFTLTIVDPCRGGVVLVDYWRASWIRGSVDLYPLFHESQSFYELNEFQLSLTETSTWLDWTGEVTSRIDSGLSDNWFWAQGYAGAFSHGDRHDFPNLFDAMAGNAFDVTFSVDRPTPYEIYLDGFVIDSASFPEYTDVSAYLFGLDGYVAGTKFHDGEGEYLANGVLPPGQYHFQAGALATLSAANDDFAVAEYTFYFSLPEPSTLLLLAMATPFIMRRQLPL